MDIATLIGVVLCIAFVVISICLGQDGPAGIQYFYDAHKYSFLSVMEYIKHMVRLVLYARILENAIPACKFFYLLAGCDKYLVFFLCV